MGTHNGEKTIERAINSILSQSFSDFEFIICNDCSTDSTAQILKDCQNKDKRIVIISNENQSGLAASLNKCIEISNGEYIARMDDDDVSHLDRFDKQVAFLDSNPGYDIVGCCRNTFDENGIWNVYGNPGELSSRNIISGKIFTHPTVMIRKKPLVDVGMYTVSKRTMRGQDFDLWCKMYSQGSKGYVLPDVLFDYYEDRNKIKENKFKHRWYNYKTHKIWRKKMGLSFKYDLYAYKELLAAFIPKSILVAQKKRKQKKGTINE